MKTFIEDAASKSRAYLVNKSQLILSAKRTYHLLSRNYSICEQTGTYHHLLSQNYSVRVQYEDVIDIEEPDKPGGT